MSALAERMAPVSARLGRLRRTLRRLFALDGAARLFLAAALFVALTFLLDWSLILPAPVRLLFLAGGLGLAGWIAWRRIVRPLRVDIPDDDLAFFVERQYPELNDRLISAIQLSRRPLAEESPQLVEALVADAEQASGSVDFNRVVVGRHVGRRAGAAGATFLVLAILAALFPGYASIYFRRIAGGDTRWPQRTHLAVLDFGADHRRVMARGEDCPVAVVYEGIEPREVILEYEFQTGEKGRERMNPQVGKRFFYLFTRVTGPFKFSVRTRHVTTDDHFVDTVTPPSLDSIRVFHEYPPYMRKTNTPPDQPDTAGAVIAPIGTRIRFQAAANEDLSSATLSVGLKGREQTSDLAVAPTPEGRPRLLAGEFTVTESASEYTLRLTAKNGLGNRDPIRFPIKGIEDRPPDIVVRDPLGDEFVTDLCERPLEIEVKDDHGIARVALEVRILSQQPAQSKDWAATEFTRDQNSRDYGETAFRSVTVLDIGKMGLSAGDHVEIRFRAEDYKDVGGRNVRLSKVYKLSVVSVATLEKELQDALEKVKTLLRNQKIRQEAAWNRTGRLIQNFGRLELLSPEQQGEVRQAGLEQNDVTSKLDGARRDIRLVMRRGLYNKIYNESAAAKLQGALDELDPVVGVPDGDAPRDGLSRVAAAKLDQSARLKTGAERSDALRQAQNLQGAVASAIQRALDFLDKWSSYQEVIRIAREIKEAQDRINQDIKKSGGGK